MFLAPFPQMTYEFYEAYLRIKNPTLVQKWARITFPAVDNLIGKDLPTKNWNQKNQKAGFRGGHIAYEAGDPLEGCLGAHIANVLDIKRCGIPRGTVTYEYLEGILWSCRETLLTERELENILVKHGAPDRPFFMGDWDICPHPRDVWIKLIKSNPQCPNRTLDEWLSIDEWTSEYYKRKIT